MAASSSTNTPGTISTTAIHHYAGLNCREILFDAWHQHRLQPVTLRGRSLTVPQAMVPIVQAHAMANALRDATLYEPHVRVVQ